MASGGLIGVGLSIAGEYACIRMMWPKIWRMELVPLRLGMERIDKYMDLLMH